MILLPIPVSAQEDRSKVVIVGWYEGTYNTTGPDGQRRGYSYEYQQAVAAHTGWKYEYVEGSTVIYKIRHNKMQICLCTFNLNFFI